MSATTTTPKPEIKAILFDFMGTCLDWHTTITSALPSTLPHQIRSQLALEWREAYFRACATRIAANLPYQPIDTTHTETLTHHLSHPPQSLLNLDSNLAHSLRSHFPPSIFTTCVQAWHNQLAWPDVAPALSDLRARFPGADVVVHANGTTRLQLDLARSSGLNFDLLVSSEVLGGVYKPARESYEGVMKLLGVEDVRELVMVACHVSDLRGARDVGMRTVYVYRKTDDILEDQGGVRGEVDAYLEGGMEGLGEVIEGLMEARE